MEPHDSPSAGRLNELVVAKPRKEDVAERSKEESERKYFSRLIKQMEMEKQMEMDMKEEEKQMQMEEEEYFMPKPKIVKYHDLLEKLWGWDRLLPKATSVSLSVYITYLEEYTVAMCTQLLRTRAYLLSLRLVSAMRSNLYLS